MPTHLILTNGFTSKDQAADAFDGLDPDTSPAEANRTIVERLGGELIDMYYTGGEYDAALVVEFPDQGTVLRARRTALELGVDDLTVLDAVHYEDADGLMTA